MVAVKLLFSQRRGSQRPRKRPACMVREWRSARCGQQGLMVVDEQLKSVHSEFVLFWVGKERRMVEEARLENHGQVGSCHKVDVMIVGKDSEQLE